VLAGEPGEQLREVLGVVAAAQLVGEHQPGVRPGRPGGEAVGRLLAPPGPQRLGDHVCQPDGAAFAGVGLRRPGDDLVPDADTLLDHVQTASVEVDVFPAQPSRLTAAQPAEAGQGEERAQPLTLDRGQESGERLRGPGPDLGCVRLR
jgi:hypothetical protein